MDDNENKIRIYRILVIAYDINEPEKWECGKRMIDIVNRLRSYKGDDIKFEVHLVGHQPNPDEITGMTVPEPFDLMIGQQFSCEYVRKMAYRFNTPYAIQRMLTSLNRCARTSAVANRRKAEMNQRNQLNSKDRLIRILSVRLEATRQVAENLAFQFHVLKHDAAKFVEAAVQEILTKNGLDWACWYDNEDAGGGENGEEEC